MGGLIVYVTTVALITLVAVVAGVSALVVMLGGRAPSLLVAGILLIVGTVPPSVLGLLWIARSLDSRWAMSGPGPFAHVGGGPAMLAATVLTLVWTAGCWTAAVWMAVAAIRGDRRDRT